MAKRKEPKVEYRIMLTQTRGGFKRTKTYNEKTLERAIETLERMEGYRAEERTPYWRDAVVKIQTREVTNWRTYHVEEDPS